MSSDSIFTKHDLVKRHRFFIGFTHTKHWVRFYDWWPEEYRWPRCRGRHPNPSWQPSRTRSRYPLKKLWRHLLNRVKDLKILSWVFGIFFHKITQLTIRIDWDLEEFFSTYANGEKLITFLRNKVVKAFPAIRKTF